MTAAAPSDTEVQPFQGYGGIPMEVFDRIVQILSMIIKIAVAILVVVLVAIVFTQVVLRFVFNGGFAWNEEASRFIFIWICFLAVASATNENSHMKLDLLTGKLPSIKPYLDVLSWILCFIFFLLLGYLGYHYAKSSANRIAGSVGISLMYIYMVLPISSSLSLVFLIHRAIKKICCGRSKSV
jgi:TRAP-type C4-dicarboxylate transport system permease small subunit